MGAPFVLSNCITIGLTAIGLMGYSNALARDRDRGVFQRLRVAPIPNSLILISRLAVQMAMIILLTLVVFIVAYQNLHISLTAGAYLLSLIAAFRWRCIVPWPGTDDRWATKKCRDGKCNYAPCVFCIYHGGNVW
jgi:hypothetical protein